MALNFEIPAPVHANRILIDPAAMDVRAWLITHIRYHNQIKMPNRFLALANGGGRCQLTGLPAGSQIY